MSGCVRLRREQKRQKRDKEKGSAENGGRKGCTLVCNSCFHKQKWWLPTDLSSHLKTGSFFLSPFPFAITMSPKLRLFNGPKLELEWERNMSGKVGTHGKERSGKIAILCSTHMWLIEDEQRCTLSCFVRLLLFLVSHFVRRIKKISRETLRNCNRNYLLRFHCGCWMLLKDTHRRSKTYLLFITARKNTCQTQQWLLTKNRTFSHP